MVGKYLKWKYVVCSAGAFLLAVSIGTGNMIVNAADPEVVVADDAGLLMEEEVDWLEDVAGELAKKSDWNVIVATCDDADGESAETVCQEYFNTYTGGDDGISCLLDMDNREIYIATAGDAQWYLNDNRIDKIMDEAYEAVADGDYSECLYLMILRSDEAYDAGIPEDAEIYDEDTGRVTTRKELTMLDVFLAFIAAFAVGGIVFAAIVGKYRLKWGLYKYDFHESGSLELDEKEDRFVNQTVTRRHIPKDDGDGGGHSGGGSRSTVSRGAGGRSFGGGGRKF